MFCWEFERNSSVFVCGCLFEINVHVHTSYSFLKKTVDSRCYSKTEGGTSIWKWLRGAKEKIFWVWNSLFIIMVARLWLALFNFVWNENISFTYCLRYIFASNCDILGGGGGRGGWSVTSFAPPHHLYISIQYHPLPCPSPLGILTPLSSPI